MSPANPAARSVTLKDIARAAGVHFSTVSLALRDHPRLPAATRNRIQDIALTLGYRRDPVLLALTARRTLGPAHPRLIFLTNRRGPEDFYNTAHMPAFLAGAREQATAMGYECDLMLVGDEALTEAEIERQLQSAGIRGLILGAFQPQLRRVQFDWSRYAVVKIDSAFMAAEAELVTHDQLQAVRLAHQQLHRLGYRRIGLAVGRSDEANTSDLFSAGRLLEQERLGLAPVPPLHFGDGESDDAIATRLARWGRRHRVDAVLSNWLSIRELLARAQLRTPADIACACLSLNAPDPALAGVIENHHWVGRKATETLALLLQGTRREETNAPSATYIEGIWQDGATAPPRRGSVS